jgi:hypothetical protein
MFGVLWETTLQQHIPIEKLARVSSYDAFGSFVLIPIAFAIVGPVADLVGVKNTLWVAATLSTVSILATLAVRDVWGLRRSVAGAETQSVALEPLDESGT